MATIKEAGIENHREYYRLSRSQRYYWFLHHHNPALSQIILTKGILGELNVDYFKKAVEAAVNYHAALRACFRVLDGKPTQFIYSRVTVDVQCRDFRQVPESEREERIVQADLADDRIIIEPQQAPLIRIRLSRLAPSEYLCRFSASRLVFDEPSDHIFWTAILRNYEALQRGASLPAPGSQRHFFEFVLREKEGFPADGCAQYALRHSDGQNVADVLGRLPTAAGDGSGHGIFGERSLHSAARSWSAITALCSRESSTPYCFFLTAFFVLLRSLTDENEPLVGISASDRGRDRQYGEAIGPFTSRYGLRVDLSEHRTFRDMLHRVTELVSQVRGRVTAVDGSVFTSAGIQFRGVERLFLERFVFEELLDEPKEYAAAGLLVRDGPSCPLTGAFDVRMLIKQGKHGIAMLLQYNTRFLTEEAADRLSSACMDIARSMAEDGDACGDGPGASGVIPVSTAFDDGDKPASFRQAVDDVGWRLAPSAFARRRLVGRIVRSVLQNRLIGSNHDFFVRGGDLYSGTELILKLRRAFQVSLSPLELARHPTIRSLDREILLRRNDTPRDTLVRRELLQLLMPVRSRGSRAPLFLVPGGGGGADENYVYSQLAPFLNVERPFYQFVAKGLDGILRPHSTVAHMAGEYGRAIKLVQPQGPYLIAGECVGGFLAYEIAQQLTRQGESVRLILMDTVRMTDHAFYRDYRRHVGDVRCFKREIKASVKNWIRRDCDFRRKKLHAEKRYVNLLLKYKPEPYDKAVSLIVSEEGEAIDEYLGWEKYVKGPLRRYPAQGRHMEYLRRYVSQLGTTLDRILENEGNES